MTDRTPTRKTEATWQAIRDGEVVETARTKRDLMWLLTSGHMDADGAAHRTGRAGTYYYTAPRGEIYMVTRNPNASA